MTQHVRKSFEVEFGRFACTLRHLRKTCRREQRPRSEVNTKGRLGILLARRATQPPDSMEAFF